ncbi:MAG: DUF4382 domain-containing protein [Deltaproteobacteria bacterium]|nr:DUF4382 domain-containing protein [Deltaproteobacteria bacterium]
MTLPFVSCGGGGGGGAGTGFLDLKLTDATTDEYQAVYVTINEVRVKPEDHEGWEVLEELNLPQTFNLLELVNGVMADLGIAELETGHYNQMRLIIEDSDAEPVGPEENILGHTHPYYNYLIDAADNEIPLKVPSGGNTGIKLVSGFDIENSGFTELDLDFEAHKSIVSKGNGGFSLKPTIKVLETLENSISGTVKKGDPIEGDPIGGAFVSAQIYDADNDEVISDYTTLSIIDTGEYKLYLPPDTYNVVVTMTGYLPACQEVDANYYTNEIVDFGLVVEEGTVEIYGVVSGLAEDADATLSIRQVGVDCGGAETTIEVASDIVTNGEYRITVPAGTYQLVATAGDVRVEPEGIINANVEKNIVFTQ